MDPQPPSSRRDDVDHGLSNAPTPDPAGGVAASSPRRARPDHRELIILTLGVLVGVLLSPAVAGRIAPRWHDDTFMTLDRAYSELLDHWKTVTQRQTEALLRIARTGVSDAYIDEFNVLRSDPDLAAEGERIQVQLEGARRLHQLVLALVLTAGLVMVGEAVTPSSRDGVRRMLISVRYGLFAVLAALFLAQPALLQSVPVLAVAVVLCVVAVVAAAPLLVRGSNEEEPPA